MTQTSGDLEGKGGLERSGRGGQESGWRVAKQSEAAANGCECHLRRAVWGRERAAGSQARPTERERCLSPVRCAHAPNSELSRLLTTFSPRQTGGHQDLRLTKTWEAGGARKTD